ncbi:MAG: tRNA (N(6)-L-threonylcarbamoyladenosine(37)-C(2))-methylthiotransferase MtaB [Candidatus Omnitrophota bacterium]
MKAINPSAALRINGERSRTIKFYTLGCKVNQYETQLIREQFHIAGFRELTNTLPAEICVINTCTVTHRADHSSLYLIRRIHRENPDARIVVTGCLAQFNAEEIARIPGVSLIVRNENKSRIISLLENSSKTQEAGKEGITYFQGHSRVFLKVQDGCNYCCSYCKVRMARGISISRPIDDIKEEVKALVGNGYLEIVICGICLGSYGKDLIPGLSLSRLVDELEGIKGAFRIRLSSIEPKDINEQLIGVLANSKRLCQHLHIPVQSGDDRILKRMNRPYLREWYIKIIEQIRGRIPDMAITTDVMIGFPGETEEKFRNTVDLIKKIKPLRVHIFPYSRRLNTPAYNFEGVRLSGDKIKSRAAGLEKVSRAMRSLYCQRFIARDADVLIEKLVSGYPDLWEGYTGNYIKVRVMSRQRLENRIIKAKLTKIYRDFVLADIVG